MSVVAFHALVTSEEQAVNDEAEMDTTPSGQGFEAVEHPEFKPHSGTLVVPTGHCMPECSPRENECVKPKSHRVLVQTDQIQGIHGCCSCDEKQDPRQNRLFGGYVSREHMEKMIAVAFICAGLALFGILIFLSQLRGATSPGTSIAQTHGIKASISLCTLKPNPYGSSLIDELQLHIPDACQGPSPSVASVHQAPIELPHASSRDDDALIELLALKRDRRDPFSEAALEALRALSGLTPANVLAFRETWTDADTEALRNIDPRANGFVPHGELTTEAFARRLPSAKDFDKLLAKRSIAVVGSGAVLNGALLGTEIDAHPLVARFNDLVGSRLTDDTGRKTSIQVVNKQVKPVQEPKGIVHIDLEWVHPWSSYCHRLHALGEFSSLTSGSLYMIRPTVFCALGTQLSSFTRGFLFYWFIGRSFEAVDMYGFEGNGHYRTSNAPGLVGEEYLRFEHFVYKMATELAAQDGLVS
eukprot:TRINITY_DN19857_c0_g1_i1.p1 TRINITY_DN19857_c0_g1~~TRINITY_DN19857_c0_g1_i1.p1  ORF type:complete len:487 (+),score=47.53 TRINITY_DN19857_c0_g1_i1:46-1461(+)